MRGLISTDQSLQRQCRRKFEDIMNTKTTATKTAVATASKGKTARTITLGEAAKLVGCTRQYLYKVATGAAGSTTTGLKIVRTEKAKGAKRCTRHQLDLATVKAFARGFAKRND